MLLGSRFASIGFPCQSYIIVVFNFLNPIQAQMFSLGFDMVISRLIQAETHNLQR